MNSSSMQTIQIPLFDMKRRIAKYNKVFIECSENVMSRGQLILGTECLKFEDKFAKYLNSRYCVSVANGTDALEIAICSLGLPAGSMIGLAGNCGGYSTISIMRNNLVPVYCDVSLANAQPTMQSIKNLIDFGVSAIIVTHIYGQANMDIEEISELCAENQVLLIEDCSQSHGARINKIAVGVFGDIATFSFYPTKNLGAFGDAGAIITNSEKLFNRVKTIRTYGWTNKYLVESSGGRNSRMDEIQAAFLNILLDDLDFENSTRNGIVKDYYASIDNDLFELFEWQLESNVGHLFVLKTSKRAEIVSKLERSGIGWGIHYPVSDDMQPAWQGKFKQIDTLQNTHLLSKQIITLPCNPYLTNSEKFKVIEVVNSTN